MNASKLVMLECARKPLSTFLSHILIPSKCARRQLRIQLCSLFKTTLQKRSPNIPPRCKRAVCVHERASVGSTFQFLEDFFSHQYIQSSSNLDVVFFSTDEWKAVHESGHTRDEGACQSGSRARVSKPPSGTDKQRRVHGKKANTTGQRRGNTGNEQPPGSPKNDKKEQSPTTTAKHLVRTADTVKEQRRQLTGDSEAHDTRRLSLTCWCLFVGVQHNLPGFRVCRRNVSPALASRTLEVELLLVIPGPVRGPQPSVRRVDVDGPVAHEKPLTL